MGSFAYHKYFSYSASTFFVTYFAFLIYNYSSYYHSSVHSQLTVIRSSLVDQHQFYFKIKDESCFSKPNCCATVCLRVHLHNNLTAYSSPFLDYLNNYSVFSSLYYLEDPCGTLISAEALTYDYLFLKVLYSTAVPTIILVIFLWYQRRQLIFTLERYNFIPNRIYNPTTRPNSPV